MEPREPEIKIPSLVSSLGRTLRTAFDSMLASCICLPGSYCKTKPLSGRRDMPTSPLMHSKYEP